MANKDDLEKFQNKLGYQFQNAETLENALRHSSFVNENPSLNVQDNERLEFLGDAVLNLIVGDMLMEHYPEVNEGDLSRMRANLVNETQLAELARLVNLGSYIQLGKGERQTNGSDKNSILSDAFEAVVAAVYIDGGFSSAFGIVRELFVPLIKNANDPEVIHDAKSQLQEYSQIYHKVMPSYKVIHECGPDHDKTFRIRLTVSDIETEGVGKSKKAAEQDAASKAIKVLRRQ